MTIEITTTDTTTLLSAPYNPALAPRAKQLGGRWNPTSKQWSFDSRDETRVRALAVEIYGTDGTPTELVTARLTAADIEWNDASVWFAGKEVLRRWSRDRPVTLGSGVILIEGTFAGRGGSMRYPEIGDISGVVLEIRDLPAAAVTDTITLTNFGVEQLAWTVETSEGL